MDDEMAEKELTKEDRNAMAEKKGSPNIKVNVSNGGRKIVSYLDKVLCLNGDGNGSDSDEEDWITTQRREEEEDDLPNEVGADMDDDPLCPTFTFSRKQRKEDRKKWRNTLIIKLMGKKIASRFLMGRLQRLWSLEGTYELTDLDNGYLLLKFKEERDYSHVLHDGPWIVADHYVIVQRWRPFFNPYEDQVKKLAVWLRIPGLPTEFYTKQQLRRIGNMLGRTLKVDNSSLRKMESVEGEFTEKARFARLCVEVDLRKSYVKIQILGLHPRRICLSKCRV